MSEYQFEDYFISYLKNLRHLKDSSIEHYRQALRTVSVYMKNLGLVEDSIYEINDLVSLTSKTGALLVNPDFVDLDKRGNNMYGAGLRHYLRFAEGKAFERVENPKETIDRPIKAEAAKRTTTTTAYHRSEIIRGQALFMAHFECEMDREHQTFISASNKKPYMECHHAIPMARQDNFENSLDNYANLICLCPICHRKIHHGLKSDRKEMIKRIYSERGERLFASGINLSEQEFIELILQ